MRFTPSNPMHRPRSSRLAWVGLVALGLAAGESGAQTVNVDFTSLFNNDAIINNSDPASAGNDTTQDGIDAFGSYITISAMTALTPGEAAGNLPDDGLFAANVDHPAIQLGYHDGNDGFNTLKISGATSFTLLGGTHFALGHYDRFDLLATTGSGDSTTNITFAYTTGGSQVYSGVVVDDWFDDSGSFATQPGGVTRYYLINGLDRVSFSNAINGANDPAIFGLTMAVDPSRQLSSITVAKTNSGPQLTVFGAVLVPEPGSAALLLGGLALLGLRRRRARRGNARPQGLP